MEQIIDIASIFHITLEILMTSTIVKLYRMLKRKEKEALICEEKAFEQKVRLNILTCIEEEFLKTLKETKKSAFFRPYSYKRVERGRLLLTETYVCDLLDYKDARNFISSKTKSEMYHYALNTIEPFKENKGVVAEEDIKRAIQERYAKLQLEGFESHTKFGHNPEGRLL
jgi:hypothetical protein